MINKNLISTIGISLVMIIMPLNSARAALEEIIVTAQKREQSLQDVPMAVTAVGRELLENNEINSIEDLTKVVPSLRLTPDGNTDSGVINIRGIGTNVNSVAVEPNVSVMLDGVVLARNSLASFDFADIERIEVLRGPQGTLFGKNASAGLVHVITRDPAPEFEARVRSSFEQPDNFPGDFMKTQFTVSGPLVEGLGLRLTGYAKQINGSLVDIEQNSNNPDSKQFGLRSKLRWDASDALAMRLSLEYSRRDAESTGVPFRDGNPNLRERNQPMQISEENREIRTYGDNLSDLENSAIGLTADWELGEFVLSSVTALRDATTYNNQGIKGLDGQRTNLRRNYSEVGIETFTQEFRITSVDNASFEYTAGVLWFENETTEDFYRLIEDLPAGFVANTLLPVSLPLDNADPVLQGQDGLNSEVTRDVVVNTRNLGVFAEGTWNFAESWHLTVGARYIDEQVDVLLANTSRLSHTATGEDVQSSEFPLTSSTVADTTVTGRVSLLHDWDESSTVYGTISTGYRGAAFDVIAEDSQRALDNPVEPEEATSFELGFKSRMFDNRLALNVSAFLTYFENFQAQVRDLENPESVVAFRLDNAGELETRGVEFEFQAQPIDALSINGSVLFNRAVYNEFITQCFSGQGPNEGGARDNDGDGTCDEQDVSGGVLSNAPKRSVSLSGRYEYLFDDKTSYIQLAGRWQDKVQFSNEQHPNTIEDAYQIWNLRGGLIGPGAKYEVAAYINNIFAQHFVAVITPLSLVGDRRDTVANIPVGADRVFGLSLSYQW